MAEFELTHERKVWFFDGSSNPTRGLRPTDQQNQTRAESVKYKLKLVKYKCINILFFEWKLFYVKCKYKHNVTKSMSLFSPPLSRAPPAVSVHLGLLWELQCSCSQPSALSSFAWRSPCWLDESWKAWLVSCRPVLSADPREPSMPCWGWSKRQASSLPDSSWDKGHVPNTRNRTQ